MIFYFFIGIISWISIIALIIACIVLTKDNIRSKYYSIFKGQAEQDKFVLSILKNKKSGFFVEIGSNNPIKINNTYILENSYGWRGIMIEYDKKWLNSYKKHRPNSIHIFNDATKINYKELFEKNRVPLNIDYLQIDLEAANGSTLNTLKKLNNEVMDKYKFATITFEHDIYRGDYLNTRIESRNIFKNKGYIRIFSDINDNGYVYEDWYVNPDLVDMVLVNDIIKKMKIIIKIIQ